MLHGAGWILRKRRDFITEQFKGFHCIIQRIAERIRLQFVIFQKPVIGLGRKKKRRQAECVDVMYRIALLYRCFEIFQVKGKDIVTADIAVFLDKCSELAHGSSMK